MNTVNYYLLGEIFGLLERVELIEQIPLEEFDANDEKDVRKLAREYIEPSVRQTSSVKREAIRRSIRYYTASESAPLQLLRDRCQELSLSDADDWCQFFRWVGNEVFGDHYSRDTVLSEVLERLDEREAELIFADT